MDGLIDDNHKHVLEEALEQFVDSQLWGKEPDIDEFVRRYPEFEHQIRKRIQKIQRIDAQDSLDTSAAQTTTGTVLSSRKSAAAQGGNEEPPPRGDTLSMLRPAPV